MAEWEKEKLAAILNAATHAISRARYAFIVSNIAGILILTGLFNTTFPWIRNPLEHRSKVMSENTRELVEKILREDLGVMNIPLLGMKLSVYDLSVLGSTALLIIVIWQFFCARREKQVIEVVLGEASKAKRLDDTEKSLYLYHGVAHHFLFTTRSVPDLLFPDRKYPAGAYLIFYILLFMPGWLPLLIVLSDLYTLFFANATSAGNPAVVTTPIKEYKLPEIIEAVVRMCYASAIGLISLFYCYKVRQYDMETRICVERMRSLNS